jgi:beta-glucosidase
MKKILLLLALFSTFSFAQDTTQQGNLSQVSPEIENAPFRNPDLPIEKRVDDLVSRMTLEEKDS